MAILTRRADQPVVTLRDAMNQLLADAFTPVFGQQPSGASGPDNLPVNVYEDAEGFYLHLLAPGVDPAAIEITAANGVLSVSGRQSALGEMVKEGWKPIWQEFSPTEFRRQLRLPGEVDASKIGASYHGGVLTITIPRAEQSKPKTIKVQVS